MKGDLGASATFLGIRIVLYTEYLFIFDHIVLQMFLRICFLVLVFLEVTSVLKACVSRI